MMPTDDTSGSDPGASGSDPIADEVALDLPIRYLQRTRRWYLALGYEAPYRWAHHRDVPFTRLATPLARARVALVTTAAPYQPDKGPQGPGAPYNASAKFHAVFDGDATGEPDLRIAHVAIDRTHAAMDAPACWFPLPALRAAAAAGAIGSVAPRFLGLPTDRSQRRTVETFAPEILARLRADAVDAVLLVPNCPVCHQSVTLVARHLEANGIATVVIGAARDVVEHVGAPRLVFNDFPLGNAAARPGDPGSGRHTLDLALRLLAAAPAPRTTVQTGLRWADDAGWKADYMNPARLTPAERAALKAQHDAANRIAGGNRQRP